MIIQNNTTGTTSDKGIVSSGFGKILDVLSTTNYASANFFDYLVKGKNPLEGAWKGLTHQEETTFSDVLGNLGMEDGWKKGALGFAGDVLLDPLTYVGGIGGLTKGGKAAKGVESANAFLKIAENSLKTAEATGDAMKISEASRLIENATKLVTEATTKATSLGTTTLGTSLTEQFSKGQRGLLNMSGFGMSSDLLTKDSAFASVVKPVFTGLDAASDFLHNNTVTSYLGKTFSNQWKLKGVSMERWKKYSNVMNEVNGIKNFGDYKVKQEVDNFLGLIKKAGDNIYDDKIQAQMLKSYERLKAFDSTTPEVKAIFDDFAGFMVDNSKRWEAAGGEVIAQDGYKYVTHIMDRNLEKSLNIDNTFSSARKYGGKTASDVSREYMKIIPLKGDVPVSYGNISELGYDFVSESKVQNMLNGVQYDALKKKTDVLTELQTLKAKGYKELFTDNLPQEIKQQVKTATALFEKDQYYLTKEIKKIANDMKPVLSKDEFGQEVFKKPKGYAENATKIQAKLDLISQKESKLADLVNELQIKMYKDAGISSRISKLEDDIAKIDSKLEWKVDNIEKQYGTGGLYKDKLGNTYQVKQADILEVNEWRKSMGKESLFTENVPVIMMVEGKRVVQKEASKAFTDGMKELGYKVPAEGLVESSLKELKGTYFEPEVVKWMDDTYKKLTNIDEINKFVKGYDYILNNIKSFQTFMNVSFHARNFVSNKWQNFLAGMSVFDIAKFNRQAASIQLKVANKKMLTKVEQELWDGFAKWSGVKKGWTGADIEQTVKEMAGQEGKLQKYNPLSKWKKAGAFVGENVEDNDKFAHYMWKLSKGETPLEAGLSVKKFLFDYQDLTGFEKNFMKRLLPYYTWTRKNIPLQIEQLVTNPGKFSQVAKAKQNIEKNVSGTPLDWKVLQSQKKYIAESFPIFLGEKEGEAKYLRASSWLPSAQLEDLSNPISTAMQMVTPVAKTAYDLYANYNTFYQSPISKYPGQKVQWDLPGTTKHTYVNAKVDYILKQLKAVSDLEKIFDEDTSLGDRLSTFLVGKIDTVNKAEQTKWYEYDVSTEIGLLEKSLEKAQDSGDTGEVSKLKARIKELEKEL